MNRRQILILGIFTYSVLLVFSILFYKERTIFIDISFHLFSILKDGTFAIQNFRFGAVCTQIFPLLASKFNFPLKDVAIIYSTAFVIVNCLVFFVILIFLKNEVYALGLLLFNTVMVTHTFYWVQSELPQGITLVFLFLALLNRKLKGSEYGIGFILLSIALLATISFMHPLLIFVISFCLLFLLLSYPKQKKLIAIEAFIFICAYLAKSFFFKTVYDNQAMVGLKNIATLFPNYFNLHSNISLLHYFLHDYYLVMLMLVALAAFYIHRKNYLKLVLVFFFFIGYVFIVNVSYPTGAPQFYIENQYLIFSVFLIVPFTVDFLPAFEKSNWVVIAAGLAIFICLIRIYGAHDLYSERLEWNRKFLEETSSDSNKKLIVSADKAPLDTLLMTWASSYEFWLLSTIEEGNSRSIIIEDHEGEFDWAMSDNKGFIAKWGVFDYSTLNKNYFRFSDTTQYVKY